MPWDRDDHPQEGAREVLPVFVGCDRVEYVLAV